MLVSMSCAAFDGSPSELGPDASTPGTTTADSSTPPDASQADASVPATSCGAHQRPTETGCACAPGFTDQGAGCVWTGIIRDPELVGDPAGVWTVVGGDFQDAGAGRVFFPSRGSVAQEIELPTLAEVGSPLALQTVASAAIGSSAVRTQEVSFRGTGTQPVVSISPTFSTCLGEKVMGQALRLQATGRHRLTLVGRDEWAMHSMQIAPDASCPLPGQIPNGDFQSVGGWSTVAYEGAAYDISGGQGVDGSVGARVENATSCDASLSNVASIPNRPTAIEYAIRGAVGSTPYVVSVGTRSEARTATAVFQIVRSCLPRALQGQVAPVRFSAGATCTLPVGFIVDDVRLVDDPACAQEPALRAADFESATTFETWRTTSSNETASMSRGPTATGLGLALERSKGCDYIYVATTLDVPVPPTGTGLALRFDTVGPLGAGRSSVSVGTSLYSKSLAFGGGDSTSSTPRQVCLDPESYGGLVDLTLMHDREGSIDCAASDPTKVVFDNFRLEEDPACAVVP